MPYYACREHYEPVDARGKGCPHCQWEAAQRRSEQRKRRPQPEQWEMALTDRLQS